MPEEHQKLIVDLRMEKEDARNKHSNAVEGKGNSLTRKKCTKNELEKSKSGVPLKYKNKESLITITTEMEEEVDSNEVMPFNVSFSKRLVELQVPKQLRKLSAMEI